MFIEIIHKTKAAVKLKPEKIPGFNGIGTHDFCDTVQCSIYYQLSY